MKTGATVRKCSIWVKLGNFLSCVTSKCVGWPWKTIGHPFYAAWSFVHHFVAVSRFKLKLHFPETPISGQNRQFLVPCDLEILQMTLKKNRAPLQCYLKHCASFSNHLWIQTQTKHRKRPILGPIWPWNFMDVLEKQLGTSSMLLQPLCIISQPSVNSNSNYSPERPKLGQNHPFMFPCELEIWQMTLRNKRAHFLSNIKLCASFHRHHFKMELQSRNGYMGSWPLWPWPLPLPLTFCMDVTFANDNNSWKFYDDTMRGT